MQDSQSTKASEQFVIGRKQRKNGKSSKADPSYRLKTSALINPLVMSQERQSIDEPKFKDYLGMQDYKTENLWTDTSNKKDSF